MSVDFVMSKRLWAPWLGDRSMAAWSAARYVVFVVILKSLMCVSV
jgi:hypothetical protein